MTTIAVAPAGDRATTELLAGVARVLADVAGADVRVLPGSDGDGGAAGAEQIVEALTGPDVVLAVLAVDATAWRVVTRAARPVALVPRRTATARPWGGRVLLPLDGSPSAAAAADGVTTLLTAGPVELVVLHVFDETTVPAFWDQPAHALQSWGEEFLARWCGRDDAHLEVRHGATGDRILEVAAAEDVDLVALGWSRRLDGGRARTVRQVASEGTVPVLLVPVDRPGVGRSALPGASGPR